ncbi:MAG: hypothetical protein J6X02_02760 [Bacilli bacterium]|nr:hypothetical protein [Bacilli bacterium]
MSINFLILGLITLFFGGFLIYRQMFLIKQGHSSVEIDNDKTIKMSILLYAIIMIVTIASFPSKNYQEKSNKETNKLKYDSLIQEHVEGIGMKETYKSDNSREGEFSKGDMTLSYSEEGDSFIYHFYDSPEFEDINPLDHEYIISYFFDIREGTVKEIYKYVSICLENEFPPNIVIRKNNVLMQITYYEQTNKLGYTFYKNKYNEVKEQSYLKVYHYGMNIYDDLKKLLYLVFDDSQFENVDSKEYVYFEIK